MMTLTLYGPCGDPQRSLDHEKSTKGSQKKGDFPVFIEKVERNCYMDNYMDSFETELEEESIEFRTKIKERLRKGSKDFLFTQWMSTSSLVLN
jgi:hypothetical protein